jgi:predicted nucleotidyltransferase
MRLSDALIQSIRLLARQEAGEQVSVRVFGSRLDDDARGGDLDLMLDVPNAVENPAMLSARVSARVSRAMNGRKVDVLVYAPNLLRLPIHEIAFREGKLL